MAFDDEDDLFGNAIKKPAVSFNPENGGHAMKDKVTLKISGRVKVLQERDDKTGEPLWWDEARTQPKQQWVLPVVEDGIDKGLWGNMDKNDGSLYSAIGKAQKAAQEKTGTRVKIGDEGAGGDRGTLEVMWNGEDDTPKKKNPKNSARKLFVARYNPPEPGASRSDEDPFAESEPASAGSSAPAGTPASADQTPAQESKAPADDLAGDSDAW